jgi:hypothetical protein
MAAIFQISLKPSPFSGKPSRNSGAMVRAANSLISGNAGAAFPGAFSRLSGKAGRAATGTTCDAEFDAIDTRSPWSCLRLTWASTFSLRQLSDQDMDGRVDPGDDRQNWFAVTGIRSQNFPARRAMAPAA